jgi:DNA-binding NtrC family response regulator
LIAATNRHLEQLVKEGVFREDLFFRLNVFPVWLPPLRSRLEDIPLLAQAFLREFAARESKTVSSFTSEVLDLLLRYSWPGNVRELRTAIEHAVVLCRGDKIAVRDLPLSVRNAPSPAGEDVGRVLARQDLTVPEAEKQLIIRTLKDTNGNRTLAAKKLGLSRRTLHRKLHEYHIDGK